LRFSKDKFQVERPPASDPRSLLNFAIQKREENISRARKGLAARIDQVWIVFDHEKINHERRNVIPQILNDCKAQSILVADSNPCFEFWLLLHFRFTTSPFYDTESVIRQLKEVWPTYFKSIVPSAEIFEMTKQAISHAEWCRRHHLMADGSGNPSTNVDVLVSELMKDIMDADSFGGFKSSRVGGF